MRILKINLEDSNDEYNFYVEKTFTEEELRNFAWSTWAEILYSTWQELDKKLDEKMQEI